MILLVLFVSFWLGLSLNNSPLIVFIISFLLFIYIWKKISKKVLVISSLFLFIGITISFINIDIKKTSYEGIVVEVSNNYYLLSSDFEKLYVYEKDTNKEIGDILIIDGNKELIESEKIESRFDFANYLNNKGVRYQIFPKTTTVKFNSFLRLNKMRKDFLSHFSSETSSLVSSIMFSRRDKSEIIGNFSSLNMIRLCSSSGLYLSFLLRFIERALKRKFSDRASRAMSFLFLLPYFVFVFPKFSIIRISLLFLLRFINDFLFNKRFSYLSVTGLSGIILLLFDFHLASQDGFIVSYSVTVFAYLLTNSFRHLKGIKKKIFVVSVLYLFVLPMEISYYGDFSILEPLIQLFLFPILLVFLFISLVCFYKIPAFFLVEKIRSPINELLSFMNKINVSFHLPKMNQFVILIYLVILISFVYFASIKLKPLEKLSFVLMVSLMFFYIIPIKNSFTSEVSFINVGQGDSILIRDKHKTALIDTGGNLKYDLAEESLIPYLKSKRIYKIDYLIITHEDYDHMGARDSLINGFKVKRYVNKHEMFPIQIGNITLNSLNKPLSLDDDNDRSLVISFSIPQMTFLLMGDASKKVEQRLILENKNLSSDILKIGHHGSKTSTSEDFINKVKPKEAVISVGKNKYGHPNSETLELLKKYDIAIRRTDIEGTITYYSM